MMKSECLVAFVFQVVYLAEPNYPEKVLKVAGCGGKEFCDYETFLRLTKNILIDKNKFLEQCPKKY